MKCECCGEDKPDVALHPAMTAYHWDGNGEDPNRDVALCEEDWEGYRDYWQERWDEYYSMVL